MESLKQAILGAEDVFGFRCTELRRSSNDLLLSGGGKRGVPSSSEHPSNKKHRVDGSNTRASKEQETPFCPNENILTLAPFTSSDIVVKVVAPVENSRGEKAPREKCFSRKYIEQYCKNPDKNVSVQFPDWVGSQKVWITKDLASKLMDAGTGESMWTLEGHSSSAYSVAWSSDGSHVASGSWDNTVRVWDAGTGKCSLTMVGHSNDVSSVAWRPDGSQVASGSYDNTVRVWDAGTGECTGAILGSSRVRSVAWNGLKLASAFVGRIQIFNVNVSAKWLQQTVSAKLLGKHGEDTSRYPLYGLPTEPSV